MSDPKRPKVHECVYRNAGVVGKTGDAYYVVQACTCGKVRWVKA